MAGRKGKNEEHYSMDSLNRHGKDTYALEDETVIHPRTKGAQSVGGPQTGEKSTFAGDDLPSPSLHSSEEDMDEDEDYVHIQMDHTSSTASVSMAAGGARPKVQGKQMSYNHGNQEIAKPGSNYLHKKFEAEKEQTLVKCQRFSKFILYGKGQDSYPHTYDCPKELHHAKLQFTVTRRREEANKILKAMYGIELEVKGENLVFIKVDTKHQFSLTSKSLERIIREELIHDLKVLDIENHSEKSEKVLSVLKKGIPLPSALLVGRAKIFNCESSNLFHLVSEIGSYDKLIKELGLQSEETDADKELQRSRSLCGKVRLERKDLKMLEYLDFAGYLSEKNGDFVEMSDTECILHMAEGHKQQVHLSQSDFENEVDQFLKRVYKKEICFEDDICYKLWYDVTDNMEPNDRVYLFMKKRLKTPKFYIYEENGKHFVCCMSKEEAEKAKMAIEKNIDLHKIESQTEAIKIFLQSEEEHKKLVYMKLPDGTTFFACTSDVSSEYSKLLTQTDKCDKLSLQKHEVEFLKRFGTDEIADCKAAYQVLVEFPEDTAVRFKGCEANFPACRQRLQRFIESNRCQISLDIPKEKLQTNLTQMEDAMKSTGCTWHIEPDSGKETNEDFKYVAAWMEQLLRLRVCVVEGCFTAMPVDMRVIIATHCLYPQGTSDMLPEVWGDYVSKTGKLFEENKDRHPSYGNFYRVENPKGLKCKVAVPWFVDENSFKDSTLKSSLQDKLTEIMSISETDNMRSIGIDVSGFDSHFVEITQVTVNAALQHVQQRYSNKKRLEVYITGSRSISDKLCDTVDSIFKKRRGCSRKSYRDIIGLQHKDADINTVVEKGSLQNINAEVLVNTTNKDLDLNRGLVSKQLLKLAGPGISAELKEKYPDGITHGEVAVSGSHKIGCQRNVKHVFHSALQAYDKHEFFRNIKIFVMKCLYKAEQLDCKTIAFPALGVGNLEYPRRETAAAMFDAVDEFCKQAIDPNLKKVIIVVYVKDKLTCDAFECEEWRRSKQYGRDKKEEPPKPMTDFRALCKEEDIGVLSSLQVTTRQDFKAAESYAVVIGFQTKGGQSQPEIKRADQIPHTWNDVLWIVLHQNTNENDFSSCLQKSLYNLDKERVTKIVIYTTKDNTLKLSEGAQTLKIAEVVTVSKWKFISDVLIVVTDDSALQNVFTHVNTDAQVSKSWNMHQPEEKKTGVKVEILCLDKVSHIKTEKELRHLEVSIQEEKQKSMIASDYNNKRENSLQGQAEHLSDQKTVKKPQGHVTKQDLVADVVSSEINPGIIRFIEQQNRLKSWIKEMENKFQIQIRLVEEGAATVVGDFESIVKLEDYLENEMFIEQENIQFDDKYFETPQNFAQDKKTYKLSDFRVMVYKYDITKAQVDCVAISCPENLECGKGVGKVVSDAAGVAAKKIREKMLRDGKLGVMECWIGHPGDLKHLKGIAYIHLPIFSRNRKQIDVLKDFKQAILHCLTAVDEKGYEKLAFPCIGSGSNPEYFPFDLLAQEYVRALQDFNPSCVTEIHFVDKSDKALDTLSKTFDKHFSRMSSNEQTSTLFYQVTKAFHGDKPSGSQSSATEDKTTIEKTSQPLRGIQVPNSQITLNITNPKIHSIKAESIVCMLNEKLKDRFGEMKELHEIDGQEKRSFFRSLKQQQLSAGQMFLEEKKEGAHILHAVCPRNEQNCETVSTLLDKIFKCATERKYRTMAFPVMHIRDTSKSEANPGKKFVELLIQKCIVTKTKLEEIHILSDDEKEVNLLHGYINEMCKPGILKFSGSARPGHPLRVSNV